MSLVQAVHSLATKGLDFPLFRNCRTPRLVARDSLRNELRDVLMPGGQTDSMGPLVRRPSQRYLRLVFQPFGRMQAHSCLRAHQSSPHHPQVGQRKQRVQLRGVLG
jgi:hypothetical protein